ncbi:diacylglycerol kinase family protein [Lysinibacillus sp. BW-2-10]|uniref:diacylglycerol kinase family protein n=1 Tax=Lysinibacillus sp. BW-2-10 TaxID=2590030 RepID=UPI00117C4A25|nr:diacylglycerol kinase family protein [Lysinibacillus sp. BW-2-10]TSI03326.1 diacylglycerol kinase family protein [Lysinibacillus sp. BW-2-10]
MDFPKLIKSFGYAFYGIFTALKEQNMRIHIISAMIVVFAGFLTGLSTTEWLFIIVAISLVIGAEMVNTAIESVVNLASPTFHPFAKQAKDVAAGAVLVFAISSVIIGLLIFIPKWL